MPTPAEAKQLLRICATSGSKKAHIYRTLTSRNETICGHSNHAWRSNYDYSTILSDHARYPKSETDLCKTCRDHKDALMVMIALGFKTMPKAVRTVMVLNVHIRKHMTVTDLISFADDIKKSAEAIDASAVDSVEVKLTSY